MKNERATGPAVVLIIFYEYSAVCARSELKIADLVYLEDFFSA